MYPKYSVLMSVYYKEKPEFLKLAVDSMLNQSLKPDDFVLVCDGKLTKELDALIEGYEDENSDIFQIVRIEENRGLGNALNLGIQCCRNELIARMDSDDISVPDRCRLQIEEFVKDKELALCSGQIMEFEGQIDNIKGIRNVPCRYEDVYKFAKKRNPMNHMAVMCKKSEVLAAGNYIELNLGEDYYLWVRMLSKGAKAVNVPETIVYARAGRGMYQRRGGFSYIGKMCAIQRKFYELGFITFWEYIRNCFVRTIVSALPSKLRESVYKRGLRTYTE